MAEVWLATDISLDRKVALKWLKPSLATDPVVAERFRREAIAVAGLTHPNIVAVHDVFEDERPPGRRDAARRRQEPAPAARRADEVEPRADDPHRHVRRRGARRRPPRRLRAPRRQARQHPRHADGRVLLTDFGIAKGLDASGDDLTSDNVMMGTAKYLSPEQVRGRKLDGRADLYSLGLVLYECLAGRVPFLGETDADTALARLQRDPTDLGRLRPTIPRGLVNLVHQPALAQPQPPPGHRRRAARRAAADRRRAPARPDPARRQPPARARAEPRRPVHQGAAPAGPRRAPPVAAAPVPGRRRSPARRRRRTRSPAGRATTRPTPGPTCAAARPAACSRGPGRRWCSCSALLAVALIVALVLWATIGRDDDGGRRPRRPRRAGTPRPRRPPPGRSRSPPSPPTTLRRRRGERRPGGGRPGRRRPRRRTGAPSATPAR